ncbi:DUF1643 domain-containing protein [Cohnella kolymensis]|uniref:DUF1643 domain-containing protein n=1 Tax=Cohnella kolymensis TaxID=1590652 RepID=UPI000AEB1940|nr:DUF1643 domain-containing protein [Cohnella kolymensis]
MKVITVIQPWATLIALGEKRYETRSWDTRHRGAIAIHASKKVDKRIGMEEPFFSVLGRHGYTAHNLPTGVIIAKCRLAASMQVVRNGGDHAILDIGRRLIYGNELAFGDYTEGRFAWDLVNVEMLKEPIPAKGQLSLWNYRMPISTIPPDPVGPENDMHIRRAALQADKIITAWGTNGTLLGRDRKVKELLYSFHTYYLQMSKDGHPKHPLYIAGNCEPKAQAEKERLAREALAKSNAELEKKTKAHDDLVRRLNNELQEAKAVGNDEEVEKLQASLKQSETEVEASRQRIKQQEGELTKKPIDVPAVVEKIPDNIQAELDQLRKAQTQSKQTIKFTCRNAKRIRKNRICDY